MKHTIKTKFMEDDCVEITIDELVFRLDLDERGLPKFPDSLKETLPPYLPEMIEQQIKSERDNPNQASITAVTHDVWCPEMKGTGRCNCNPDIFDLEENGGISSGKLTCKVCDESSTGEVIRFDLVEDDSGCWERLWIEGGDMFYWVVGEAGTEITLLICHLCMIELGIKFPNVFKDAEDAGADQPN